MATKTSSVITLPEAIRNLSIFRIGFLGQSIAFQSIRYIELYIVFFLTVLILFCKGCIYFYYAD